MAHARLKHAVTSSKRMKKFCCVALLSLCWTAGLSQPEAADRFVGTWLLQLIEQRSENGDWVESEILGLDPLGILIYDAHGNMAAQLARRDRTIPDAEDSPEELVDGYVAYFGNYEIDTTARTVTHHRVAHVNADLGRLSVVRYYQFDSDSLVLTVAPDRQFRLTWKRQE